MMARESETIWRWPSFWAFSTVLTSGAPGQAKQAGGETTCRKRKENSRFHFNFICVTSNGVTGLMDLT